MSELCNKQLVFSHYPPSKYSDIPSQVCKIRVVMLMEFSFPKSAWVQYRNLNNHNNCLSHMPKRLELLTVIFGH